MAYLIDTTILARLANVADAQHVVAAQALLELHRRGEVLHVTLQDLIEFRKAAEPQSPSPPTPLPRPACERRFKRLEGRGRGEQAVGALPSPPRWMGWLPCRTIRAGERGWG